MRPLVFLETSDIGTTYCAEAARLLGYDPLFYCQLNHYDADPRKQLLSSRYQELNTQCTSEIITHLSALSHYEQGAIVSLVDSRLVIAQQVSAALNIAGLDPTVVKLKSKSYVYKLVPERSPLSIGFTNNEIPFKSLCELLSEKKKLLIKPDTGAGAAGIVLIRTEDEITHLPTSLQALVDSKQVDNTGFLAQEFVEGSLISLEGFVENGIVVPIGFTDRKKVGATESEARFPVDDLLPTSVKDSALTAVRLLVMRSGFQHGYFHIEFIVANNQAVLIDANMGRLGGGPIAELLAIAYNIDPSMVYRHYLQVTLKTPDSQPPYTATSPKRAASFLYGIKNGGQLLNVNTNFYHSSIKHTQLLGPGATVSPMGTDDWSWIGIVTGLEQEVQKASDLITIVTPAGVQAPCH